jgi:hypothetical protein
MTKKQVAQDVPEIEGASLFEERLERSEEMNVRTAAVEYALQHHKINGGMLTVAQLIDNAKQFHAYISGEQA